MKKTSSESLREAGSTRARSALARQRAALASRSGVDSDAVKDVAGGLNTLAADVFALYLKAKNFHWHVSGPHFRDYHDLLEEHAKQLFAMVDPIAERVRKLGEPTIKSIGNIARLQRLSDSDADDLTAEDMLAELMEDEKALAMHLREVHEQCSEARDLASASLIENWIDETEQRAWFLFEITRRPGSTEH